MKVYLAGLINNEVIEQCTNWRKKIREHYDNWKGFHRYPIDWLDPINGESNCGLTDQGLISPIPSGAITLRDHSCVTKMANLIVANMDMFGTTRYPIGTIMEVAWAYHCKVPVICIASGEQKIIWQKHPMFVQAVSIYCESVEELIEKKWINFFYKGWNTAQY